MRFGLHPQRSVNVLMAVGIKETEDIEDIKDIENIKDLKDSKVPKVLNILIADEKLKDQTDLSLDQ